MCKTPNHETLILAAIAAFKVKKLPVNVKRLRTLVYNGGDLFSSRKLRGRYFTAAAARRALRSNPQIAIMERAIRAHVHL